MSLDENKEVVRRLDDEAYNKGNLAIADLLISPQYVNHRNASGELRGPELIKRGATSLRAAFPDLCLTSEELIAEGDRVVHRFTLHGTHIGTFLSITATQRVFTIEGIAINRVVGGQIIESWSSVSVDDILRQLRAEDGIG